ncbi:hypothetical protein HDU67_000207 [Dinochytrium kinnereticum]|nr:hypothetical protein HDU67_000207 [Dinochytrium kinnereticum]
MSNIFLKRLTKELRDMQANPPAGISIEKADDNLKLWVIMIHGAAGTIYEGEIYKLQFKFGNNYPLESPEVIFIGDVPMHPHERPPDNNMYIMTAKKSPKQTAWAFHDDKV